MSLSAVHPLVAAKQALVDRIARQAIGTTVLYGRDPAMTSRSEAIVVSGGRGRTVQEFLALGRSSETEQWTVDVDCVSAGWTREPVNAESVALRLANTVADVIASDPTLGGVVDHTKIAGMELIEGIDDGTGNDFLAAVSIAVEIDFSHLGD